MNITKQQMKTPLLTGECIEQKRAELKQYFLNGWQTYESLFSLINNDDAFYSRPEPLRHPLIFYYGHTATFFINKLVLGKYIDSRLNEKLEAICAVGVDEMSWDDLNSEHYDWPAVDEVRSYRNQVSALVCQLIDEMPLSLPIKQDSLAWIILMGCEHERIHLETSSVIMRMLPLSDLNSDENWQPCPYQGAAPENRLVPVQGADLKLGKAADDHTYGWDNEYGSASISINDFETSQFLVSNQEFISFIEAGGYQTPEWWTEEGQHWLAYTQATMPRFWLKKPDGYYQRNLTSEMRLPLDWPVEVNYLEAKAFCHWKSINERKPIRLLTEPEWYVLRQAIDSDLVNWQEAPGNINLEYFASSSPVNRFEHNGIYDIVGNVWQWTESAIDGFEGFKVHPLYDDFSTPTFDGKHNLIKGGSWISTGNEAIKSSRYAFRRHFFQHAGFRYVSSEHSDMPIIPVNQFETNRDICQLLHAHYGENSFGIANYSQALAAQVTNWVEKYAAKKQKLLDIGCSVGRTAFELAPTFAFTDAVDFSARYIQHGVQLQSGEKVRFETVVEGEIVDYHEVSLTQLGLQSSDNLLFSQGDASNLKAVFNGYDVILAQQVLEQCYDPKQFLQEISSRLNAGGLLIIASDYCFDSEIAQPEKWLGGIKVNGENVFGLDGVKAILSAEFELLEESAINSAIQANSRQISVSKKHISLWRKAEQQG